MTPCPPEDPCNAGRCNCENIYDPLTCAGCPPGQQCAQIQPGYWDGICEWAPASGNATLPCDCLEECPDCCCQCLKDPNVDPCKQYILQRLDPGDYNPFDPCGPARYACEGNDDTFTKHVYECNPLTDPPDGSVITKECHRTCATCLECNRLPKLGFYGCYTELDPDGTVKLSTGVPHPVYFNNSLCGGKCTDSCYVYSVCNTDPATFIDDCMAAPLGTYCYEPDPPEDQCAEPDPGGAPVCIPTGSTDPSCQCPPGSTPAYIYNVYFCPGLSQIGYCTFQCDLDPCFGIICDPGFECVGGECVPI